LNQFSPHSGQIGLSAPITVRVSTAKRTFMDGNGSGEWFDPAEIGQVCHTGQMAAIGQPFQILGGGITVDGIDDDIHTDWA
jgi:hypothetical protein